MANSVRIIGGTFRRRHIKFAAVDGLRPTPDRVRETLFNWLGQTLNGLDCLDLFAGSGALGFEALSRGARRLTFVDTNTDVCRVIKSNCHELGIINQTVSCMAAVQYLKQNTTKFDIVFVDPPYGSDLYEAVLAKLPRHLSNEGKIYVESDREILPSPGANVVKKSRAGRVHYALWEYLMNKDG